VAESYGVAPREETRERDVHSSLEREVVGTCFPRITCKPQQAPICAHLRPRSSHLCETISRPFFFWRRPANEAFPAHGSALLFIKFIKFINTIETQYHVTTSPHACKCK